MSLPPRAFLWPALVLPAALVLSACSGGGDSTGAATTLTPKAVAAVSLEVLGETAAFSHPLPGAPEGTVGAELQFRGQGAYRGDRVQVSVRDSVEGEQEQDLCRELRDTVSGCDEISPERSTRLYLTWRTEVPSKDPGIVTLTRIRGGETSTVSLLGPVITSDPRTLLSGDRFSVPGLRAILEDPRLDLVTDSDTLDLAERLRTWQDPAAPETSSTPLVTPPATDPAVPPATGTAVPPATTAPVSPATQTAATPG